MTGHGRRRVVLAAAIAVLASACSASAAVPIRGGHYLFDTPQSNSALFPGRWPLEDSFGGGWSLHVFSGGGHFTTYSFIEALLPCSPWEWQHWAFTLDGRGIDITGGPRQKLTASPPVRIGADGTFSAGRRGEYLGGEFDPSSQPYKTSNHATAWLSIAVRFTSRRRARGWMRATSTDGCSSGWLPLKGRYLRRGWQPYLDRT
jgi:hypothetical protein